MSLAASDWKVSLHVIFISFLFFFSYTKKKLSTGADAKINAVIKLTAEPEWLEDIFHVRSVDRGEFPHALAL